MNDSSCSHLQDPKLVQEEKKKANPLWWVVAWTFFPLPLREWGKPRGSTQHFSAQWEDVHTTLVTWNGRRQELEGQDYTYLLGGKNSIELLWWCQEAFSKGDLTSGDFDTNRSGLGFWRSRLSLWKWQWNCQFIEYWWDLTSHGCRDTPPFILTNLVTAKAKLLQGVRGDLCAGISVRRETFSANSQCHSGWKSDAYLNAHCQRTH